MCLGVALLRIFTRGFQGKTKMTKMITLINVCNTNIATPVDACMGKIVVF